MKLLMISAPVTFLELSGERGIRVTRLVSQCFAQLPDNRLFSRMVEGE